MAVFSCVYLVTYETEIESDTEEEAREQFHELLPSLTDHDLHYSILVEEKNEHSA